MAGTWWIGESELDEDQKDVISLSADGNHLVIGPPGSGKTNILLLRANYLTLSGKPNLAIVVFNKTLRKFIAAGGKEYRFPAEKIMTSAKWMAETLRQYGVAVESHDSFNDQRAYLISELQNLSASRNLSKIYDAVLLDEAQDYSAEEIALFHNLSAQLFAVADSRQQIYGDIQSGQRPLQALTGAVDGIHKLRYHYRNGRKICELADRIGKDSESYEALLPTSQYDEAANPSRVIYSKGSIDHQVGEVVESLRKQLRAFPAELLGVVCPTNSQLDTVCSLLQRYDDLRPYLSRIGDDEDAFDPSKPICLSTIHGAKGLEMRALHIVGAEQIGRLTQQRNIAFTAVTRAKTSLAIYSEDEMPGWLCSALENLEPPKGPPHLGDLFRRDI